MAKSRGIHCGTTVKPGGRYDRFLKFLDGKRKGPTTLEIVRGVSVCAVNSVAAELRAMGYNIECDLDEEESEKTGSRVYRYRWIKGAPTDAPAAPRNPLQDLGQETQRGQGWPTKQGLLFDIKEIERSD